MPLQTPVPYRRLPTGSSSALHEAHFRGSKPLSEEVSDPFLCSMFTRAFLTVFQVRSPGRQKPELGDLDDFVWNGQWCLIGVV